MHKNGNQQQQKKKNHEEKKNIQKRKLRHCDKEKTTKMTSKPYTARK